MRTPVPGCRIQLLFQLSVDLRQKASEWGEELAGGVLRDASEYQKMLQKTRQMSSVYAGFSDSVDSSIPGLRYHFRGRVCVRSMPPRSNASSS